MSGIAIPALETVRDAAALRGVLHALRADGRCVWIRLGGLSAENDGSHVGLMRELTRFGLGAELRGDSPDVVVLDWSSVSGCTADGLALFGVVVRELMDRNVRIIVCSPSDADAAEALKGTGLRSACMDVHWVPGAACHSSRLTTLGPAALFGCAGDHCSARIFAQGLYQALVTAAMGRDRAERLVAATVDLLQNVITHSGASYACAVALLRPRKRPPEVEVGIVDSGRGITIGVLSQERHAWLLHFTDGTVASAALTHGLSGRREEDGGGALAGLIRGLIEECGATIVVRSGAALLRLAPPRGRCEPRNLSCGWGTQTLIRMRVGA